MFGCSNGRVSFDEICSAHFDKDSPIDLDRRDACISGTPMTPWGIACLGEPTGPPTAHVSRYGPLGVGTCILGSLHALEVSKMVVTVHLNGWSGSHRAPELAPGDCQCLMPVLQSLSIGSLQAVCFCTCHLICIGEHLDHGRLAQTGPMEWDHQNDMMTHDMTQSSRMAHRRLHRRLLSWP